MPLQSGFIGAGMVNFGAFCRDKRDGGIDFSMRQWQEIHEVLFTLKRVKA